MAQCFAFRPQDQELIDLFLHPKLAAQPLAAAFIHDVDIYSAAPEELVAGLTSAPGTGDGDGRVWYFFSPVHYVGGAKNARRGRKSRTVGADGNEFWHSETGPKTVKDSAAGGKFQKFSYKVKTASGVVKPGWLMVEYSIDTQEHGGADLVLCKVYRSPRAPSRSRASLTTSAALSESACKKRKAEEEHPEAPPPCSARQQTTDEEDDDVFAEGLNRALTSEGYVPEDAGDHHPAEAEALPCSMPRQTDEIVELFETIERDLMSDDGDMLPLLPFGLDELERYLFGDEPGAPPPCALPAEPEPEGYATVGLDELERYLFGDEPGAPPPCALPAEPEAEGYAAVGLDQTAVVHGPCPDDALQVAAACLDEEEGVQLELDDEFISGLPCPPFEPAYIEDLLSASGDVPMSWTAQHQQLYHGCAAAIISHPRPCGRAALEHPMQFSDPCL